MTSASGQRTYDHAIREFVAWYCSEPRFAFNRTVVLRYRIHFEPVMRGSIGAIGLAVVLVELHANAQTQPDFSGTWIPAETTSVTWCITQDAATLRVALTAPSARPDVYNFDGTETRQTFAGTAAVPADTLAGCERPPRTRAPRDLYPYPGGSTRRLDLPDSWKCTYAKSR